MIALNFTQYELTPDQAQAVHFTDFLERSIVKSIITFDESDFCIIIAEKMKTRANALAEIAIKNRADVVLIGGAPFFQSILEQTLLERGIGFMHALSARKVVESTDEKGIVHKTSQFTHVAFAGKYGNGAELFLKGK